MVRHARMRAAVWGYAACGGALGMALPQRQGCHRWKGEDRRRDPACVSQGSSAPRCADVGPAVRCCAVCGGALEMACRLARLDG